MRPTKEQFRRASEEAKRLAHKLHDEDFSILAMAIIAAGTLKIFREDGHGDWMEELGRINKGDDKAMEAFMASLPDGR